MKNPRILLSLLLLFFISCDNELEPIVDNSDIKKESIKVIAFPSTKSSAAEPELGLWFENTQVFNEFCNEISELPNPDKIQAINNLDYLSIAEIYEQAMREAATLDFTENQYKSFKAKYNKYLYFPEYKDDYGPYLPYKNTTLSYVTNENGRYMIGNNIIQEETIKTYNELQQTGQALYQDQNDAWRPPTVIPPVFIGKTTVLAYELQQASFPVNKVKIGDKGYEYVENWTNVGNGKKIRVTFGRILKNRSGNIPEAVWHSEVSFRKKGFLGAWYNYSSETSIQAIITYTDRSQEILNHRESGASSHDGYIKCKFNQLSTSDFKIYNIITNEEITTSGGTGYPPKLYQFPSYRVNLKITYRGMPQTMYLEDKKPALWAYTKTKDNLFD